MYVEEQKRKDDETRKLTEEVKKNQELLLQQIAALSKPKKQLKKKGIGKANLRKMPTDQSAASSSSLGIMQNIRSVFGASNTNLQSGETTATSETHREDDTISHHSGTSSSSFAIIDEDPSLPLNEPTQPRPTSMPSSSFLQPNLGTTTKKVYITKCSLRLQNNEIDQLTSRQTIDQAMNDYHRLYLTNGLANSLQSSYINYQTFMNGCFISAWDLSTSGFVGNSYALPNIKTGTFKVFINNL
jgi:hypothetical protein